MEQGKINFVNTTFALNFNLQFRLLWAAGNPPKIGSGESNFQGGLLFFLLLEIWTEGGKSNL